MSGVRVDLSERETCEINGDIYRKWEEEFVSILTSFLEMRSRESSRNDLLH